MSTFFTDKKPIKVVSKTHNEWLANRKGIGSSDIATLMGCNKHSTPYQLWLRLTNQQPVEEEENFLMKMGHKLEPIIAELWEDETGHRIIKNTKAEYMYVHPEYDFLRASPDREFKWNGQTAILECKSTQLEVSQEELPPYWFCQVQYQMGIAQKEYCNIAWLISGRKFGYAQVVYNDELFHHMMEVAKEFWIDCVVHGKEPKLETIKDVEIKYPYSTEDCIEADENVIRLFDTLYELRDRKKEIEEREKSTVEQIKLYMKQNSQLIYEGKTLATWRTGKDRETFDANRFKSDYPELYQEYVKLTKGSRPLLIK